MSPTWPPLLAALAVVVVAAVAAPGRRARRPAVDGPTRPIGRVDPMALVGAVVRRRCRRPPDPRLDRRTGRALVAAMVVAPLSPPLAVVGAMGWAFASVLGRRRRVRRGDRDLVDELPEVVDLLRLSVSAGGTVPLAVGVVAEHGQGRFASELGRARDAAAVGSLLADALDQIPARLGDPVRPVTRALSGALRHGAPLGPALDQVAADVRTLRRRAAEERARRASVRLLFPLVCCTLPAFALLTVVPLLLSALRDLSL